MPKLSHFFVPHHKNNYRAHLLKPASFNLAIIGLLLLQLSFSVIRHTNPSVLGISYSITPQDIISQTNDQRGKLGLPPLNYNGQLTQAAQAKGQHMLANQYWAHVSPDGKEPWFFITGAGYQYARAGENLAKDFRDSISVVNAWMASPGHRANIVNTHYKDIGIAVVSGPFNGYETVIVVQMFGDPLNPSNNLGPETAQAQQAATPRPTVTPRPIPARIQEASPSAEASPTVVASPRNTPDPQILRTNNSSGPDSTLPDFLSTPVESSGKIDPNQVLRVIALGLGSLFAGLLAIDGYIMTRQRLVRTTHGHSILHAVFLAMLIAGLLAIQSGSIV